MDYPYPPQSQYPDEAHPLRSRSSDAGERPYSLRERDLTPASGSLYSQPYSLTEHGYPPRSPQSPYYPDGLRTPSSASWQSGAFPPHGDHGYGQGQHSPEVLSVKRSSDVASITSWQKRQTLAAQIGLRRYPTRRVNLIKGTVLSVDYPVPSAILNSVESKYREEDGASSSEEFTHLRCECNFQFHIPTTSL
jgi:chitin synthase